MTLVEKLADSAKSFGVSAAYGDPVVIEGKTFVPVALVGYGFGGGTGEWGGEGAYVPEKNASSMNGHGTGDGGGGGGYSIPIGAYVTSEEGNVYFQPNLIALLTVGIPFVISTGWALSKILKAAKK
jgi:uncharacterized spore protein YtfJ